MRSTREKCEELAMTMEFLEGGAIRSLKGYLRKYFEDHENDDLRTNVDNEVTALIEQADSNRKDEDLLNSGKIGGHIKESEEEKSRCEESVKGQGHL
jgi:hypothetical protein